MDISNIKEYAFEKIYEYVMSNGSDFITEQWQVVFVLVMIALGWLINKFDRTSVSDINFKFDVMPSMRPIRIPTADKGFWGAIKIWLFTTREWELTEDFIFYIDGIKYYVPKGFRFDGASVPKFLAMWLSPVGILLVGAVIHDWLYKNTYLKSCTEKELLFLPRSKCDKLFREICISVNGFTVLNYCCWIVLKLFGFIAWNKHRNND